jgi:hypothetical protein
MFEFIYISNNVNILQQNCDLIENLLSIGFWIFNFANHEYSINQHLGKTCGETNTHIRLTEQNIKFIFVVVSGMQRSGFPETKCRCFGNGAERISRNIYPLFREWSGADFPKPLSLGRNSYAY